MIHINFAHFVVLVWHGAKRQNGCRLKSGVIEP